MTFIREISTELVSFFSSATVIFKHRVSEVSFIQIINIFHKTTLLY